jgi:Ca-activated chloride channel homolog
MPFKGFREAIRENPVTFRVAAAALVLILSVTALMRGQKPAPSRAPSIEARLELAAGEVTLKQGATASAASSGAPLKAGAGLETGKGARALVRLSDGSALFFRGDTRGTLASAGLELATGEVWLDAPDGGRGALVHHAGAVTLSAADAGLSLRRVGAEVTVYVARGLAVVTAPSGRVEVNAGEQVTITDEAPPKVAPVTYWDDWTGGMGDHRPSAAFGSGAGRIYGVDRSAAPGSPARTLEVSRQVVRATVRDGLAETEVDQTFSNPGGQKVEGWYWFSVPERAVVTSFAVETDGQLIEGEVIEQREAAAQYQAAIRSAHEPALLEWVDGRSYRARIFPVPASGSRRVVLRYMEVIATRDGTFEYVYPLRGGESGRPEGGARAEAPVTIGEFALTVDLGDAGAGAEIATLADAVIEDSGRRVSMRRSGYTPRADFQLEAKLRGSDRPFRVARFAAGGERADYVMARYVPDVDWAAVKSLPADLAVVVDTSASADEAARAQKSAAAEAVLRSLSPADHFTLIALDSAPAVLYPKDGLAEASDTEISAALERLAEHQSGGATDLGALFDAALGRLHGKEQPSVLYIGDGIATTGEVTPVRLTDRLRRSLTASRARFFTVAVGASANHALLRELAREGSGQAFRIQDADGEAAEVLRLASAIKTPTITDLTIEMGAGLDEPMVTQTGKVARGEEILLLARTHHALPTVATVSGRLGGKDFRREYPVALDAGIGAQQIPRLWAAEKLRRLVGGSVDPDDNRGKIVEIGIEYGLMTPFTSILALESEVAYRQQGIQRRSSPLRGVRLTALEPRLEREMRDALTKPSPALGMGCSRSEPSAEMAAAPMGAQASRAAAKEEQSPEAMNVAPAAPRDAVPVPQAAATAMPGALAEPPSAAMPAEHEASTEQARGGGRPLPSRAKAAPAELGVDRPQQEVDKRVPAAMATVGAPVRSPPPPPPPPPNVALSKGARDTKDVGGKAGALSLRVDTPRPRGDEGREAKPRAMVLGTCSDTARRPLAERIVLWSSRLRRAAGSDELIARYEGARVTCEIEDWRSQAALLDLVQAKVKTEGAAAALLEHFVGEREAQRYLAHGILRRTVDPRIVAVVRRSLFGDRARWAEIDNDLAALKGPGERIDKLRQLLAGDPDDPEGELRLVRLLAEANQKEEALSLGRRLRDRGFMSPTLALELGDVLARSGFDDDASRTYSEIVEFDPTNADSRRLLGDVYLRHGWYPAAYRQYKTLTDTAPGDPLAWLRLGAAAAGSGRIDEALRLQRQVAAAEGTPGPNDPRVFARLLSAAYLGRLLADPKAPAGQAESVTRKLKELALFTAPSALCILTWEDYETPLTLTSFADGKEIAPGDVSEATPVGLVAAIVPTAELSRRSFRARWRVDPKGRGMPVVFHALVWDGKSFNVKVLPATLPAKEKEIALWPSP